MTGTHQKLMWAGCPIFRKQIKAMDKNILRNFVLVSALLVLAALVFAAIETKGKEVESRFGVFGVIVVAVLLLLSAYLFSTKQAAPVKPVAPAPAPTPVAPPPATPPIA